MTGLQPGSTALIVIDMQRDFCAPGGYAARAGLDVSRLAAPIAAIGRLLGAARAAGWLVVHTREGHRPDLSDCPPEKLRRSAAAGAAIGSPGPLGRLLVRGEAGHDFIDELQPLAGEPVVDKPGYGAFHQTDLAQILAARGIATLVLCGVTTEVCVHSTLREAVDRGFRCITVGDACAGSSPALHAAALAMVGVEGGIFGRVAQSAELLA
ncbi:cysteine hydrolase family protein [Sphaerotilaceae bacterium SBD11-9]